MIKVVNKQTVCKNSVKREEMILIVQQKDGKWMKEEFEKTEERNVLHETRKFLKIYNV